MVLLLHHSRWSINVPPHRIEMSWGSLHQKYTRMLFILGTLLLLIYGKLLLLIQGVFRLKTRNLFVMLMKNIKLPFCLLDFSSLHKCNRIQVFSVIAQFLSGLVAPFWFCICSTVLIIVPESFTISLNSFWGFQDAYPFDVQAEIRS